MPGKGIVVVRTYPGAPIEFNTGVEPVTWLHEFGHTLGIPHNNNDEHWVMATGIGPDSTNLEPSECATYKGSSTQAAVPAFARPVPVAMPADAALESTITSGKTRPTLEQFVKHPFLSGFPVDVAKTYDTPENAGKAEALLSNHEYEQYRSHIVALLGVIGSAQTLPILEEIITTPVLGRPTDVDISTRLAALIAIGTIANRFALPEGSYAVLNGPRRGYAITGSEHAKQQILADKNAVTNAAVPKSVRDEREALINEAIRLNTITNKAGALSVIK